MLEEYQAKLRYIEELRHYIKQAEKFSPVEQLALLKIMIDSDEKQYTEIVDGLLNLMEKCKGNN